MRCENSGTGPATTASTDRSTACDHRRPHGLVADCESCGDLSERYPIRVEVSGVLSDQVGLLRSASGQPRRPIDIAYCDPVHVEPCCQLPHRYPSGVLGDQLGLIGDAQTGLRLMQISADWAALIGDPSAALTRPTDRRSP